MRTRTLGNGSLEVSTIGYGCMGLSGLCGQPMPRPEAIGIIRAAVDRGATFFPEAVLKLSNR